MEKIIFVKLRSRSRSGEGQVRSGEGQEGQSQVWVMGT